MRSWRNVYVVLVNKIEGQMPFGRLRFYGRIILRWIQIIEMAGLGFK
jgi:hypothetical protein